MAQKVTPARPAREIASAGIVLRGSFNPAIFQPSWMSAKGLLRDEEADSADIQVIHPDVTSFTASWLTVNVTREQFHASSADINAEDLVRDFAAGTFRILEHTPVSSIGLNHAFHYSVDAGVRNVLGDQLVPTEPWSGLQNPSFSNLQVTSERADDQRGSVNVQLQPSVHVEGGLFILVNDHYELEKREQQVPASEAVALLSEHWDSSRKRAERIAEGLFQSV